MALRKCALSVVAVAVIIVLAFVLYVSVILPSLYSRTMSDFAALWNTTDALQHHVLTNKQWPRDWEALTPSLAYVDAKNYSSGDISFLKDRVEINFDLDLNSPRGRSDWYVRLKSGGIQPEQENANQRLGDVIGRVNQSSLDDPGFVQPPHHP